MGDLKNAKLIYLKGFLFAGIVLCSTVILLALHPDWRTAALTALLIWASARTYYFMFYVIEKYVDGRYRFSGIGSFQHGRRADDHLDQQPAEPEIEVVEGLAAGKVHYNQNCAGCHGADVYGNNILPDLRYSPYTATEEAWNSVVIGGALVELGMISFEARIDAEAAELIRAYVVSEAHR